MCSYYCSCCSFAVDFVAIIGPPSEFTRITQLKVIHHKNACTVKANSHNFQQIHSPGAFNARFLPVVCYCNRRKAGSLFSSVLLRWQLSLTTVPFDAPLLHSCLLDQRAGIIWEENPKFLRTASQDSCSKALAADSITLSSLLAAPSHLVPLIFFSVVAI